MKISRGSDYLDRGEWEWDILEVDWKRYKIEGYLMIKLYIW